MQQGRLQNKDKLSKDELMDALRFGADKVHQVLSLFFLGFHFNSDLLEVWPKGKMMNTVRLSAYMIQPIAAKKMLLHKMMMRRLHTVQGDQDHFLTKEMAIALKRCISDPKLVKSKCV